ncbi:RES family NAD+ phosphorylase [Xanthobacter flavus]|uniref:RES family NAD+ phosphorylase n=1 Tax=Xanthobacter flavus TaxID=281 RepID=UPI00372CC992
MTPRRQLMCCTECFNDRHLKRTINDNTTSSGRCNFCGTSDIPLLDPKQLADLFAPLITIYEEFDEGRTLVEWFAEDWNIFSSNNIAEAVAFRLLGEILDDGEITRRLFRPSDRFSSNGIARWEQLRTELMYVNRFFPDANIDVPRLSSLLPELVADSLPTIWYRARLMDGDVEFQIKDMGPPPARRSSHGRANPPGIPYLYLGSDAISAISEVRPHTGEMACVAEFRLREGLRLVDLRDPRMRLSPFSYGDEDKIGSLREDLSLLARLGDELTRPVLPSGAAIDYVPSQYLCELIKNASGDDGRKVGYDGVLYNSAVGGGINLALFDPTKAEGGSVTKYTVKKVSVDVI